jgi:hypothetical protein
MRKLSVHQRLTNLFRGTNENEVTIFARPDVDVRTRISLYNAINGKVIEVATYDPKPQSSDPDWEYEFYIVPEGESLSAAVSTVMTMKSLIK